MCWLGGGYTWGFLKNPGLETWNWQVVQCVAAPRPPPPPPPKDEFSGIRIKLQDIEISSRKPISSKGKHGIVVGGTLSVKYSMLHRIIRSKKVGVAVKVIREGPRTEDAEAYPNLDDYLQINQQHFETVIFNSPSSNAFRIEESHKLFGVFFLSYAKWNVYMYGVFTVIC